MSQNDLLQKASNILSESELKEIREYLESGKPLLSADTAARFYELFLNGSSIEEIHRLNPAFPIALINIARIKYSWDEKRDKYFEELYTKIKDKVIKAQLETTSLMTDLLSAANKLHGDKIKKFIQTNDETYLKGVFGIDSLAQLVKVAEALQKITGQSNQIKIKNESYQVVDLRLSSDSNNTELSREAAAEIIAIVAEEKRKKLKNNG